MSVLKDYNLVILLIFGFVGLLSAVLFTICALKRFELAIALILFSPWAHWLLGAPVQEGDAESIGPSVGTYIRILMILFAGFIGLLKFLQIMAHRINRTHFYLFLFGGFILYALGSTVYSIDQKYTCVRSFEFLFFFFFLLGFFYWLKDKSRLDKALDIYFIVMVCGIGINIAAIVLFSGRVRSAIMPDRIQGLLGHPNTLGAFCMLTYPILLWKYSRVELVGKGIILVLFGSVLLLHILSGSRASFATSVIGLFVLCLIKDGVNLISMARIISACLIIVLGGLWLLASRPASLNRGTGDITDLTGRTEFWQGCIQLIKEKPIIGYGYGVGGKVWDDPRFYRAGQFLWSGSARASLHNGYLSIAIGLGIVGFILWSILVFIPTWKILELSSSNYKALVLVMLLQGMILNFFESAIVSGSQIITSLIFWIFIIIAMKMSYLIAREKTNPVPALG